MKKKCRKDGSIGSINSELPIKKEKKNDERNKETIKPKDI